MSSRVEFKQGLMDIAPMLLAYLPIAALWGTIAAAHGFSPMQALLMSAFVYSGAAQFVALDLGTTGITLDMLVLAVFTMSLRHVLMSASVSRHMQAFHNGKASILLFWLTDEAWALLERRALQRPITPAYFLGAAAPLWMCWSLFSAVGAWLGKTMGDTSALGLDFAFAAMFIAVLAGFWKGAKTASVLIASALVAVLVKIYVPGAWYILSGGVAGMLVAATLYRGDGDV